MSVNKVNSDGSLLRVAGGTLYADAPIGTISPFGGSTIPNGYLLCNGAEVLKTTYAELYAVIGDAFGTASVSTKFVLPDFRGEFLRGAGTNSHTGQGSGGVVGEHQDATAVPYTYSNNGANNINFAGNGITPNFDSIPSETNYYQTIDSDSHGANSAYNFGTVRPTNTSVNYIIKAKQVAVPFDVAEYIRNQNVLSDYENITLPTSAATAMTMPYDGFYILANYGVIDVHHIYLNGVEISGGTTGSAGTGASMSSTIPFKKGDTMYRINTYSSTLQEHVAYYKLRDYTGR